MVWSSPDQGDTFMNLAQMPIGAMDIRPAAPWGIGAGLSESGWWVEDNNTLIMGDIAGWIYKTLDRGASWTEGALTAIGLEVTHLITSPDWTNDDTLLVGTFDPSVDFKMEVWVSQDEAMQDLENVGAEINTDPAWPGIHTLGNPAFALGGTVVQFDPGFATNDIIYGTGGGWMDRWELVGTGSTELTRIDFTDVGVYRTELNRGEPAASTWEQMWGANEWNDVTKMPQPLAGMLAPGQPGGPWDIYRYVAPSGLEVGNEGSLYIPYHIWDLSYNSMVRPPEPPTPNFGGMGWGRFTNGGVLRCLEPTETDFLFDVCTDGLGEWDGLWLNDAVAGSSNTLISLAWDWQEWRFKMAIYDDTLCTSSTPSDPTSGETGVGTLAGNQVSVTLQWSALDADTYEWQVDDDCGFTPPMVASGVTSEELVTVTGLEPGVSYCWRSRALTPTLSRWSDAQNFTTVIGAELLAPELLAPAAGSTIQEDQPMFQWSAIGWADKYDIQVATDSGFASSALVVNENLGNVQAYQSPTELADSTYYWHVKAKSGTSQTEWSATGTFTVGTPAGEGTAGWVWALIVIGVVLIILMLMLIMRTRRPA
jgi:hypothetical protein